MKRILFLPFLQIPSGHHQVADSLTSIITSLDQSLECEKIDILQYSYGKIEALVSSVYLKWIHTLPNTYHWLYQKQVYNEGKEKKSYKLYEQLFLPFMKRLIQEKNPDIIICSHALPSYMLNVLKKNKMINTPIINVYTDYFIHSFWGKKYIDYHFVPHEALKETLKENGVEEHKIYITGIPVHPLITRSNIKDFTNYKNCTVMGGSLGVGMIEKLIPKMAKSEKINYRILCGKNETLYKKVKQLNNPLIEAFPYISSRKEMNRIYKETDVVITKPGGITISECLSKGIPALIYHALPGQEQINLHELKKQHLVIPFEHWDEFDNLDDGIILTLDTQLKPFKKAIQQFHESIDRNAIQTILSKLLHSKKNKGVFTNET
ncbi:MGDG synthase family glycosyltransferase [Litchfieldia alkalitelluris]|uniref:MGDG synthase family glycosyltransferase n=1 Tax=Litchfieldia alkalitelluris TaxID=304268 RepID=UPI000997280F|nr:glycosyltransferase [Litchfieldia alkalitelluris]